MKRIKYPLATGELCEICFIEQAHIYAAGNWLCVDCEEELSEDLDIHFASPLEWASAIWKCKARII